MPKCIYLCYFGLREPLVQTQVLPYLLEIAKDGIDVSLLTFESDLKAKWTGEEIRREREALARNRIKWHYLPYHKRPSVPATFYDILNGLQFVFRLNRRERFDVFHSRGHIPAPIAAVAKSFSGGKFLFDIRGFMPEEYADAGVWKANGLLFRGVKRVERWLISRADGFVVLTERAREILFPDAELQIGGGWMTGSATSDQTKDLRPVEVIPCCVDFDRFDAKPEESAKSFPEMPDTSARRVIVYVGSFGGWYLTAEMLDFFEFAHRQDASVFVLVLTQRDVDKIAGEFRVRGFAADDFFVTSASPEDVFNYLKTADLAISFIRSCYSKLSSSPTKIAEYLAAGLPVISNSGVGDLDAMIAGERVGVILDDFTDSAYAEALSQLGELASEPDLRERCRSAARRLFDLANVGGTGYRRIYARLLQK